MPGHRKRSPVDQRRAATAGKSAEEAVADYLIARGLEILDVNLHVGRFEIDILARDGAVIAVVEVRTRGPGSFQSALASIDSGKRARLRAAATRLWRSRFRRDASVERIRFDVATVMFAPDGGVVVEHIAAAF